MTESANNSESDDTGAITRRGFIKTVAAAGTAATLPSSIFGADGSTRPRPDVVAIYCPLWHRYDHMDSWHGYGWNEWELLKSAPPRFPGHYQPLKPSWGCFDESDPKWSSREIDLAADHNIDVFLFDWYWYSGVRLMEEALEKGFLAAPNRHRLKFALMWANHNWEDYFPAPYDKPWNSWLPHRHSAADLERVFDYGIEHYFREPNYWKIDGRLVFAMFQTEKIINELGGPGPFKQLLDKLDQKLARANLPPAHWHAMNTGPAPYIAKWEQSGFRTTTTNYNVTDTGKTSPNLTQDYEDIIPAHVNAWNAMAQTPLPHCPLVTMGWDVTARCDHSVPWPFAKTAYPYTHVLVGNTPERFGRLCKLAADFAKKDPKQPPAIFVNSWNEWTEGSYLLPEERYGTGYLEAIKEAFPRT